jgi:hypothetical protein
MILGYFNRKRGAVLPGKKLIEEIFNQLSS